jgi:zinc and cadmium transporter
MSLLSLPSLRRRQVGITAIIAVLLSLVLGGAAITPKAAAQEAAHSHDEGGHTHSHDEGAAASTKAPATRTNWPNWLMLGYCVAILGASMFGGWLPSMIDLTHNRLQLMISFVGGLMLGIGMFHMLPHAIVNLGPGSQDRAVWWMTLGVLTMFVMLRTFHFHHHSPVDLDEFTHAQGHEGCAHDHDHSHDHSHDQGHGGHSHGHGKGGENSLSWVGVFLGLGVHTFLDGMAVAASVEADVNHGVTTGLLGLGTFLAVLLHKPLDAVSITWLMSTSGWSKSARTLVNAAFAAMCPLGAFLFVLGVHQIGGSQSALIGCSLAFAAGLFVCISLSDLLPEIEFHRHHRVRLSLALLLGVALAYGIGYLEPAHVHGGGEADHGHIH